jgi:hypothetical protein
MKLVSITKATDDKHKYQAVFDIDGRKKTTKFGQAGAEDFTIHKDEQRKENYISRHKSRENWSDPTSAGALSKFILWNKPTLRASISDYKKHFNF